jgi:hypothetical protein
MPGSAGAYSLALLIYTSKKASDDKPRCLENPRLKGRILAPSPDSMLNKDRAIRSLVRNAWMTGKPETTPARQVTSGYASQLARPARRSLETLNASGAESLRKVRQASRNAGSRNCCLSRQRSGSRASKAKSLSAQSRLNAPTSSTSCLNWDASW